MIPNALRANGVRGVEGRLIKIRSRDNAPRLPPSRFRKTSKKLMRVGLPTKDFRAHVRKPLAGIYGPTIAAYRNIDGDADRVAALDADIARVGDGFLQGGNTMEWEYLLLTARKA